MNDTPPGGIFNGGVTEQGVRAIPLTLEQRDVSAIVDDSTSPSPSAPPTLIVTEEPRFQNLFVTRPEVKVVEVSPILRVLTIGRLGHVSANHSIFQVPEYVEKAGEQADKMLLQPNERRQIMLLER